ncbi:MAG: hypothetical protein H7A23_03280 [Leptospiraceae bacterium]|nr:hypothetical protein [Leptospiraceae bacterium]MCP5493552.1 hypothetical protein [Leptospiraceae bacterium]
MIKKSIWKEFTSTLKTASLTTGKSLKYIYDAGNNHKHYLVPVLNGFIGDKLAENNHQLSISMSFRENGKDISIQNLDLKTRCKNKRKTIAIFIHGLVMDDVFWHTPYEGKPGFGSKLEQDLSIISLYVRYNTGKHISQNGKELSDLLQNLMDTYEDEIEHIVLITHSMGGLVARSASYYATKENHNWTKRLSSIFLLGVPNDGSFLEKIGHLTTTILKIIPNLPTRIVGHISDQRSNGIKDLRWGILVEEDWKSPDSDTLLKANRTKVEPLPGVKYYIIAGTMMGNESSLVSTYFGDGLVGRKSAIGEVFHSLKEESNEFLEVRIFRETSHLGLLMNQNVYEYIKGAFLQ